MMLMPPACPSHTHTLQGTSPATSVGTLGAQQDSYAVLSPPASPASSPAASEPLALSQAGSRAGTPEPLANLADAEAVCMVGLALQLAQVRRAAGCRQAGPQWRCPCRRYEQQAFCH